MNRSSAPWWWVALALAVAIGGVLLAWEVVSPGVSRYYTFL